MMETPTIDRTLQDQLNNPRTAESLARLAGRAPEVDELVGQAIGARHTLGDLLATVTDVCDEQCRKVNETGTSVDQRLGSLVELFLKVTEPETAAALGRLVDRLPQLEAASRLLDEVPGLLAIAVDVFDEYARNLKEHGVELEKSLSQGLHALLWLGCRVSEEELDRLGELLRSDVLDPHALEVVGNAATALATCQRQTCEQQTPERTGLLGLLTAIRDPNVQRTLSFGVRFARCFGGSSRPPAAQTSNGK